MKNPKTHRITMKQSTFSEKKISYLLTSMIFNQEPLRYGSVMKLELIATEGGTRSSLLTIYFMVN